ncbi:hypothetical protein BJ508DRAFT_336709 [Ascobolus immersus RN42]|uniref:Uncharacterized protein n=1 Tax=Ascobolus immersus RN42 TaxID=1160509 RepID=A0A3N4H7N0_ASCIM|nr:hypothetical protein BJ508DRAFT_336709 [Ascobolus immersus RN42]
MPPARSRGAGTAKAKTAAIHKPKNSNNAVPSEPTAKAKGEKETDPQPPKIPAKSGKKQPRARAKAADVEEACEPNKTIDWTRSGIFPATQVEVPRGILDSSQKHDRSEDEDIGPAPVAKRTRLQKKAVEQSAPPVQIAKQERQTAGKLRSPETGKRQNKNKEKPIPAQMQKSNRRGRRTEPQEHMSAPDRPPHTQKGRKQK